jgi:hypothetical protein
MPSEAGVSPHRVRSSAENRVDGDPRPVVGVGPEMAVGVERLGGAGVPEPGLNGLHRLPVPDEQARVDMAQGVHGDAAEAGPLQRRAPDPLGEPRAADRVAELGGEEELVGRPGGEVDRQGVDDDLGQGTTRTDAWVLGGAR